MSKRRMPTNEEISIAIAWLECNEGEANESPACAAVAEWLQYQSDEREVRQLARERGVRPAVVRAAILKLMLQGKAST